MKQNIQQLFEEFIKEQRYSAKLSKITLRGYESSFALLIKIMPTITVETLSTKTLTEFFSRLEKRERIVGRGILKKGIKRSTVATYRSKLNKFFDWLKSNNIMEENPFKSMEYPYVRYEDIKFLKKEDVEKIIIAIEMKIDWKNLFIKKRNLAIISVFLCCGIRKGELLGLKIYDIDLPRRILTVRAETSKSRITRTIPLNTMALYSLEDYFSEMKKKNYSNPYLFASNKKDEKFTDHGLKHLVELIKEKAGVNFHVHQFRHTFAVNLLNMGCDIAKLKQLMGHKDIRMTDAYLRCLPTDTMRQDIETLTMDNLI